MKPFEKTSFRRSWALLSLLAAQICGCWALLPAAPSLLVINRPPSTGYSASSLFMSTSKQRGTDHEKSPGSQSEYRTKTADKKSSSRKRRYNKRSSSSPKKQPQPSTTWQEKRQKSLAAGNQPLLSLNLNLDALVRSNAPGRAQELFTRIRALHSDGYYATAPDVVSFNTVLKGFQDNPSAALDFWHAQIMEQEQQQADEQPVERDESDADYLAPKSLAPLEPNTRSFNTILLALAKAGQYEPAMQVLNQMREFDSKVLPDRITYNTVLLSFAMDPSPETATKAQNLLLEMMDGTSDDHNKNDKEQLSDGSTSTAGVVSPDHVDGSMFWEDAESIGDSLLDDWRRTLKQAVRPDTISFNTVIAAWAHCNRPDQAQAWLKRLQTYGRGLSPDVYSYSTVIQAWAKKGKAQEALALLQEMIQDSQQKGKSHLAPNIFSYTAVVQAFCQSRQPEKAQELVNQMLKKAAQSARNEAAVYPNTVTFTILINGWSKVAQDQPEVAIQNAQSILHQMKTMAGKRYDQVGPNELTYTAMLKVIAQARLNKGPAIAAQVMEDLLNPDSNLVPSLIHFNVWLDVVAKAPNANRAIECWYIFQHQMGGEGDSITFETILSAAANAFGHDPIQKQSLQIGHFAYAQLLKMECPTSLTFLNMMKLLRRFGSKHLDEDIVLQEWKSTVVKCLEMGCLNDICRSYMHKYAPDKALEPFVEANGQLRENPDWSRHALAETTKRNWK